MDHHVRVSCSGSQRLTQHLQRRNSSVFHERVVEQKRIGSIAWATSQLALNLRCCWSLWSVAWSWLVEVETYPSSWLPVERPSLSKYVFCLCCVESAGDVASIVVNIGVASGAWSGGVVAPVICSGVGTASLTTFRSRTSTIGSSCSSLTVFLTIPLRSSDVAPSRDCSTLIQWRPDGATWIQSAQQTTGRDVRRKRECLRNCRCCGVVCVGWVGGGWVRGREGRGGEGWGGGGGTNN